MTNTTQKALLVLESINSGRDDLFQSFYTQNQQDFITWAIRYGNCQLEDAEDIYQDATMIMYSNIVKGKLNKSNLTSSLKTYLFGIAKNLFMKSRDQKAKYDLVEDINDGYFSSHDTSFQSEINHIHEKTICNIALKQLTGKERQIIHRFYYDRFCIGAIREEMGYGSENVVRVKKQKTVGKLRRILTDQFSGELNYKIAS